jgi:protein O-mannosyl-transferase
MTDESRAGSSYQARLLLPLALAVTFVAYSGTLRYEFVYDDGDFIVRNHYLTSWKYFPNLFTEHLWSHRDYNRMGIYYRPLFSVWALISRSLLGLNSTAWHLLILLMYFGVVAMVYMLVRRLLKDDITAGFAALVFALNPLHMETAAWVCGASESLLALLLLPSFLLYLKSQDAKLAGAEHRQSRTKWGLLSLGFFVAALFAKETAIVLPAIIFAYEMICGRDSTEHSAEQIQSASRIQTFLGQAIKATKQILPFIAISAIYVAIRGIVLGILIYQPAKQPLLIRLLTIPSLLWGYVRLLVWPVGLSEFYDTPYVLTPGFSEFVLPLVGVILGIIVLAWAISRVKDQGEKRMLVFACAWIVIPILPVLNVGAFRTGDLIHDRYLFLSTMGFAMLVGYGLRKVKLGSGELFGLPRFQALLALLLAGGLGVATAYQHVYWANDIVLFHHSLSVAPGNEIAQVAFGDALSKRELYDEAILVLNDLVESNPNNQHGQYNLGYNYYKVGKYKEALPHLIAAVNIDNKEPRFYLTLGVTLFYLDKYEPAEQVLREAIRLHSSELGLHYALGAVLKTTGRLQEALEEFKQELRYNPDYASARDQIEQIKTQMEAGNLGHSQ